MAWNSYRDLLGFKGFDKAFDMSIIIGATPSAHADLKAIALEFF